MGQEFFFLVLVFLCSFNIVSSQNVCCSETECYSMDPPWNSEIRPLPRPRCTANAIFRIYTRSNPNFPFNTTSTNITVTGSPYDPRKPTIFIFHGWMNSTTIESVRPLVMAILACVDANVIVVDYSNVTASATYSQAVSDIRVVARRVSMLVRVLTRETMVAPSNIHLIGISLGAHTAAYVAKLVPGLGKLTGILPKLIHLMTVHLQNFLVLIISMIKINW
ncbi:hypothetical protein C0J52_09839 [Blattella germanica]|nr:hypothetical protein C0J52_09839 [Blattella germanica]